MRNAHGGQRVQKRMQTHTALGLTRAPFQNEASKSHIFQRQTQLLVFSRMLSFLTPRRASERAARWSVSVYAAELSPFTPFVVVLEREGVLNPSRSTSSKRFPSVSTTWTPRPVKVKLWETKVLRLATHTAPEIYCLLMGLAKAMRRIGGSQKQYKHRSPPQTPLSCPVRERGRNTGTSS